MNSGKSFEFFSYAATAYKWATHIGKMDLDSFPYLHKLTTSLHEHMNSSCGAYIGVPMDFDRCNKLPHCPPQHCGLPQSGSLHEHMNSSCGAYIGVPMDFD